MGKTGRLVSLVLVVLLLMVGSSMAAFPKPMGYVNDFINVIDPVSYKEMETIAKNLKESQGIEIAVVTVASTDGMTAKEYAVELFSQWGIGGSSYDTGLLMLLVIGEEDGRVQREIQVEVGYGLEGDLPDGKVGAILDNYVLPHFSEGQYGKGLLEGMKAYAGELTGESYVVDTEENDAIKTLISFFVIVILLLIFSRRTPLIIGPRGTTRGRRGGGYMPPPRGPSGGGFGGFGGGKSGGGGAGRKF
ncbi:MAG: TPM domain-containing protein [Limnochordia bacterium]|nr:TPM domain-containing protein [Limnochordia bacterium]